MNTGQQSRNDVWERWGWLWNLVFYATGIISAGLMLRDANRTTPVWVPLLLTAVLLLWHWGALRLCCRDKPPHENANVRFAILLVDAVLWFVLVTISPAYYLLLFGLFVQVFHQLPIRYAAIMALLLMAATIVEQLGDSGAGFTLTNPTVWPFLLLTLGAILIGIWVSAIIEQSVRRRKLIEELEAAQAELAVAERREGVLEERQRLAREIHDTLAQGFTSIVMHLEAAEQALPDDPQGLQRHLDQARTTARSSLDQARRVVQDLRPDLLEESSLPDALERTAVRWQEETGLPLSVKVTGRALPLPPNIEVTLLRAAQEALNNVRKHARATAVQLTLSYMDDVVILDVQDNGQGLSGTVSSPFSGSFGLQAMCERAAQCGGFVEVESEPGEGTTVVVTIPLDEKRPPERTATAEIDL